VLSEFKFQYTLLVPCWWLYISRIWQLCLLWDIHIGNFLRYLQGGDVWVHGGSRGGSRRAGAIRWSCRWVLNFELWSECIQVVGFHDIVKLLIAFLWRLWYSCAYGNDNVFGGPHFGCVEHGVTLLLLPLDSKRYPSTKLNDGEPCMVQYFWQCSDLRWHRFFSLAYNNHCSHDRMNSWSA